MANAISSTPSPAGKAEYHIRTATLTDLSPLVDVLVSSFYPPNRFNRWLYPVMRVGINEDLKLRLRAHSPRYYCLAAIAPNEQLVGTAEVALRSPLPLLPQRAYVSNLAVSDGHRRRGVARQLLQSCEVLAQSWGKQTLYLHVAKDNIAAQQLYDQLQYHPAPSQLESFANQFGLPYSKQLRVKHILHSSRG
ncbi:MAG: GNAT family N-acetyltransferase [Cyanobacteria bacterium J06632_22]